MPVGQMPVGEQLSMERNTRQIHKGGPPWMCGQHNVRVSAGDSTGQNTDKGHTSNPRTEMKIPDPARNWTQATGLESRDPTDHTMATDSIGIYKPNYFFTIVSDSDAVGEFYSLRSILSASESYAPHPFRVFHKLWFKYIVRSPERDALYRFAWLWAEF